LLTSPTGDCQSGVNRLQSGREKGYSSSLAKEGLKLWQLRFYLG